MLFLFFFVCGEGGWLVLVGSHGNGKTGHKKSAGLCTLTTNTENQVLVLRPELIIFYPKFIPSLPRSIHNNFR
ncbi:hypothetical protein BDW02DRAFT_564218 [Decorospora gaudefroyi]|uniref:Uncharacterized protein n=1 Tax=Decorospora gaudefroyi TaxID=184978 RepID=A0A6A5KW45_9PLEO|nr:hypothetical protein BDW02DRAFT_564218 [Decorospora gaudefroyi]